MESSQMSVKQVAMELDVHEDTVRRWLKEGQLPYRRHPITGRYVMWRADVEMFREKREQERGK